jgi:hypothetical protein
MYYNNYSLLILACIDLLDFIKMIFKLYFEKNLLKKYLAFEV